MRVSILSATLAGIVGFSLVGCQALGGKNGNRWQGSVDVRDERIAGNPTATGLKTVYVANFDLETKDIKTDSGIGGVADEVSGSNGILGRLSQRFSRSSISGDAEQQTPQIISTMTEDLIASFREQGIPAQRIASTTGTLPADGWLVQGKFTDVDEGNRLQRAAVGFGMGATQMNISVAVSDLASTNPRQPFVTFGTNKDPGMKPGGFNPYAIAAKFHMEKNATAQDIQKTADQIVAEVLKYKAQLPVKNGSSSQAIP